MFLEDAPFSMHELTNAIRNSKLNKACDDCGLSAELLQNAPHALLEVLLDLFNHVFFWFSTGDVPCTWRTTLFRMLAKTPKAKTTADYRPIANLRLLHKVFFDMILQVLTIYLFIFSDSFFHTQSGVLVSA